MEKSRYVLWREKNPKLALLKHAKKRAKKKGREFTLTEEDIEIPTICPVLGIPIEAGGVDYSNSPSIDRLDQSKGYTPDNVIVVSYLANITRNNATPQQIVKVGRFYHKLLKNKNPTTKLRNICQEAEKNRKIIKHFLDLLLEEKLVTKEEFDILLSSFS